LSVSPADITLPPRSDLRILDRMRRLLMAFLLGTALAGCSTHPTRLQFSTFDGENHCEQAYTYMSTGSYRKLPGGLIELVCRAERASTIDPTQTITQIVHLKTFWDPRPGTTFVESTQIDGDLSYAVLTPPTGVRYDGSGFLTYKLKKNGDLEGKIESGTLSPRFSMGDAAIPFTNARLEGDVYARENPADVVNTIQSIDAQFSERVKPKSPRVP
jgi:hypothetical protein